MSAIDREARDRTEAERLAALGHKPQWDGHCEHRWRNRTSRAVHCRFLDGWREGRAFGAPLLIDAAPALPAGLPDAPCESCARKDAVYDAAFKEFARFTDEKEAEVASLRRAGLPDVASLEDIHAADMAASLVHDFIWQKPVLSGTTPPSQEQASDAIWTIHRVLRPLLAALEGSATLPSDSAVMETKNDQQA